MIGGKVLCWAIVATYGLVGVASSQLMLCIHQDGHTQIELAALLCCESPTESPGQECADGCTESSAAPCQDDQCKDVPLTLASPQVSATAPALDTVPLSLDFSLADLPAPASEGSAADQAYSIHSRDHPPESHSKEFLRTVILRL